MKNRYDYTDKGLKYSILKGAVPKSYNEWLKARDKEILSQKDTETKQLYAFLV